MIPAKAESHWCELNISEIAQLNPQKRERYRERFELKRFIENFAEFPVWYPQQPWVVSELNVLNIQATIQDKERHFSVYRKKCDELWLLSASEGHYPSSNFASSEALSSHAFQTRFDRVFYLDGFRGDIVELKRAS